MVVDITILISVTMIKADLVDDMEEGIDQAGIWVLQSFLGIILEPFIPLLEGIDTMDTGVMAGIALIQEVGTPITLGLGI